MSNGNRPWTWRYKITYGQVHKHGVFGPPHTDGGDYAPLAVFSSEEDARLASAAPTMFEAIQTALFEAVPLGATGQVAISALNVQALRNALSRATPGGNESPGDSKERGGEGQ